MISRSAAVIGCVLVLNLSALAAAASSLPPDITALYERKEYQKVIDELARLDHETSAVPDVRRLKIRTLLNLGNPREALSEYDQLQAALKQDDLPLLQQVALSFILVLVKDMREQMRGAAYTALKEMDPDEAVPYFEDGLSDGSGPVRVLAVEGLSRSAAGRKSKKLRTVLDDQAGIVKARAVKAIGKSGDRSLLPLIDAVTKDELATVRIAASAALIRLGRKDAWEQLRKGADAANPEERADALRTITELDDQRGIALMIPLLNFQQPSVRAAAARGLGHLHQTSARADIERLLDDPVAPVREAAAAALADLGGKESVARLTRGLNDGTVTVRAAIVAALLQLGEPYETVASTARALAQHNDPAARSSAAFALGKATSTNREGAVGLLSSLADDPLPGPAIVALRSLGHLGDKRFLPRFKESLHHQNEAVRATAAGAVLHVLAPVK